MDGIECPIFYSNPALFTDTTQTTAAIERVSHSVYNPLVQQGSIDDTPLFARVDMNKKSPLSIKFNNGFTASDDAATQTTPRQYPPVQSRLLRILSDLLNRIWGDAGKSKFIASLCCVYFYPVAIGDSQSKRRAKRADLTKSRTLSIENQINHY